MFKTLKLIPTNIFLFKVNNRNTRKRFEICSKLILKTPERRQWRRSVVFIVNSEQILHIVLVNGSWDIVQLSNFNRKIFMLKGLFLY